MHFISTFAVALIGSSVQALPVIDPAAIVARIDDASQSNNHFHKTSPLATRQASDKDTTETTDGDNVITKSKSLGTTRDKIGYSWHPVGSTAWLVKRQGNVDDTVVDDKNVVTISKSQGTTNDRIGYKWRSTGL